MTKSLSYPEFIMRLQKLLFFERATAHILAGCLPRIRTLSLKIGASRHFYQSMTQAYRLRSILSALGYKGPDLLLVSPDWLSLMTSVDRLRDTDQVLFTLCVDIKTRLLKEYRHLSTDADPLLDAHLLELINSYLPHAEAQRDWFLAEMGHGHRSLDLLDLENWYSPDSTPDIPIDEALWAPLDRAPSALRPEGSNRGENGELATTPHDILRDRKGIGIFLHNNINEEYATLELSGRNSYEHPDMPWEFHLSVSRHVDDEARHAQIQERLAARYGVRYGDYPFSVTHYDMLYAFDCCEAGSKRELLWRLLLRMTYHEGLALDSNAFEIERRNYLGQQDIARVFHYLLADEISHVENGIRWSRALAEKHHYDILEERNTARNYYLAKESHERLRFIVKHTERAISEARNLVAAQQSNALPFAIKLNLHLRRQAGFSDADIQQVQDWGVYQS
jgi:uncharacterized ferritin-like protein (DUF455 family)